MEKGIVRRQKKYKKQKRNGKENPALRGIQINSMRHHITQPQGSRPRFDKLSRSRITTSNDNECPVPTHENTENSSEFSQYPLLCNDGIIRVKRQDGTFDKKMTLPTSSYCGKKCNAIMLKANAPDLEMIMLLDVIKNVYMNLQKLLLQVKIDIKQTYRPPTDTQFTKYLLNVDVQTFITFMRLESKQNIKKTGSLHLENGQEIKEKISLQIIECQQNHSLECEHEIKEYRRQQTFKCQPKQGLGYGIENRGLQKLECQQNQIILYKDNRQEIEVNESLQKIKCIPKLSLECEIERGQEKHSLEYRQNNVERSLQKIECQKPSLAKPNRSLQKMECQQKQILLFKDNKQKFNKRRSLQTMECHQKQILFKENRQLKISIEQKCIRFLITLDKFHTFSVNLIQAIVNISKFCSSSETQSVPSISVKGWHIRNMTHGYLLALLLRNCNVASLNTMRNLYFVIITTNTPNLTIEFNFKLLNGLNNIMAHPFKTETETTFETIYFNEAHKEVLDKATHINATMFNFVDNRNNTNTTRPEYEENSFEISCTKRPSQTSVDTASFVSSLSELDSEYFDLPTDSRTTPKDSLNTLTYSIDEKLSYYSIYNKGDCIDSNFTDFLLDTVKIFNNYLEHGTNWITNLLLGSNSSLKATSNSTNGHVNNFCIINEGLFDLLSLNDVENIFGNLTHVPNPHFCKLFAKDLGKCTIHTLFNYYPVPVNI